MSSSELGCPFCGRLTIEGTTPQGEVWYFCESCNTSYQRESLVPVGSIDINDAFKDAFKDDDESLSVEDAADIWMSNGMDEDYMFGYTEAELKRALNR